MRSKGFRIQITWIATLAMFMVLVGQSQAAPKAELWARWQQHDPASAQRIDHGEADSWCAVVDDSRVPDPGRGAAQDRRRLHAHQADADGEEAFC